MEDKTDEFSFDPAALERRISKSGCGEAGPSSSGYHSDDLPPPLLTKSIKFKFSAEEIESTMGFASLSGLITLYDFPPLH